MRQPKPGLPPGIRLHLESANERMRALGVTEDALELALTALAFCELLESLLARAILDAHRDDGWRARRRLKRELTNDVRTHVAGCAPCRYMTTGLAHALDGFLEAAAPEPKTAP